MSKPVILTGIRANNDLTIGNYFGAMKPMVDMALERSGEFQVNMFIPDLHSFTTTIDHSQLYEQVLHNARLFVAAGLPLTNDDIYLYRQSFVPAHSELTWILDCFTSFGEMRRMTQFKDKSQSQDIISRIKNRLEEASKLDKEFSETDLNSSEDLVATSKYLIQHSRGELDFLKKLISDARNETNTSVGLFNYPVLMAADILLYGAKYVPVGDDQTQHLEFARDIAERMNARFGDVFVVPEPVAKQHEFFGKDQGLRIMDLQTPTKKMSKSDDSSKGVIFLGDDPELAAKKVMSATTDDRANVAYDRVNQPGISNLIDILALLRQSSTDAVTTEFGGMDRYGDFKQIVARELAAFLTEFQARLAGLEDDAIIAKLESSEAAMRDQAGATLHRVQQAIGLRV